MKNSLLAILTVIFMLGCNGSSNDSGQQNPPRDETPGWGIPPVEDKPNYCQIIQSDSEGTYIALTSEYA